MLFHTDSTQPRPPVTRVSAVPPTEVTYFDDAGYSLTYPLSPELAVMTMPGWLKVLSSATVWVASSGPPQLFDTYLAPSSTDLLMAAYRSVSELLFASTSMMLQLGHTAETIWTSSEISPAQP